MQSHLTRRVCRAIVNNEPLHFSSCRNRLLHTISPTTRPRPRPHLSSLNHVSQRTLFAFNLSTSQAGEGASTLPSEKGLQPMTDLKRTLEDKSRAPPTRTLTKAFQLFFTTRGEFPGVITLYQARLLSMTWKHLKRQQKEMEDQEWQDVFSVESLERMIFVISEAHILPEARDTIMKIARFAYLELCADHGFGPNCISRSSLLVYINLLAMNGNSEEARHTLVKFGGQLRGAKPSPWLNILKGFAIKDDRQQLRKITQELEQYDVKFDQASHEELIDLLIAQNLFKAVQTVYECPITGNSEPSMAAKIAVTKHSIFNASNEWATPIFESLPLGPLPDTIGISLLWEAARSNSAQSLAAKAKSWFATNPRLQETLRIAHLNDIIQYANSVQNPQLAAAFASLAREWGLDPDEQTYLLLLESHIQAGDVESSLEILENRLDPSRLTGEKLPLANDLITILCKSEKRDELFQQIASLLDPLFEDEIRLEPTTIAALTHMLLYRHDWEAVSDLLRPRLGSYDSEGRSIIRTCITDFILDFNQSESDAWEVYQLLKLAFPETGVAMRTEIMCSFFERGNSEHAVHVFGHMRQAEDPARRPKPDTYARCFQGLSRMADATNLDLVHNMLKLDLEVELNTRVYNGLMLAYAACEMAEKSMEIFRQILQSEEGPSYKTIAIFFQVCQKHHNGTQEALKMMQKLKKLEFEIDRRLYTAYIEALSAQCEFDLATEAIDQMQAEIGVPPTSTTIGLFYNAIVYQYWKDQVEEWAQKKYPDLWTHLAEIKRSEHEEGLKFEGITNEVWV